MTENPKKSVCPEPLDSIIRVHNARQSFDLAKPTNKLARREALKLILSDAVRKTGIDPAKLETAALLLPDAINVNLCLSKYGIHPKPIETVRILQWTFINKSVIPWPQGEIDRFNSLLDVDGFTSDRLKYCAVCSCIFWARRKPTEYCEKQRCGETYKKRKYRKKKRGVK